VEGSLEIRTLHKVIYSNRVWRRGAIQNTQSQESFISLKLLGRKVEVHGLTHGQLLIYTRS
jgi:hypothetical protein